VGCPIIRTPVAAYFRLMKELAAVARQPGGLRIVRLPVGATVRVSDEQLFARRGLIEVFHEGDLLSVFAEDLQERAEQVRSAGPAR
jgi:methylmalonyl-CoA mutase cobalamin-binding subunit